MTFSKLMLTLRHQLHVSWLIAFSCLGIVIGTASIPILEAGQFASIAWLLTGIALVLLGVSKARAWVIPIVIVGGALIGLWRGAIVSSDMPTFEPYFNQTIELSGIVAEDSDINARGQTVLRFRDVSIENKAMAGTAWITIDKTNKIQRSDRVIISGQLSEGFGSFDASVYRASVERVERPRPGDIALDIRNWFSEGVGRAISQPEASLGLGYLVGQRRGLPEELDNALKAAGLTHIVVASGYNLTILVRFTRRLFENLSKYLSFFSASSMILAFVAITGLSPSMSRAGLVAGLSLLAWYYGRRFHPLVLLPFAAAITVLIQPSYAWGDIGWQLSFAAFGGVMIMAPLIQAYFFGDKSERPIRRILIETISAQLWTLPILLLTFGQVSVVAPIANLLILPLVPLAMLLTFVAGVGALITPSIAQAVGFPAELLLTYMTMTAKYTGNLSWAVQEVSITVAGASLLYGVIIAASYYMWFRTRLRLEQTSLVE